MGYSNVELANQALDHLGRDGITSLTDSTAQARKVNAAFTRTLNEALARSNWTFARKIASLAEVTNDYSERWDYKYDLPNDCIKPVRLIDTVDAQRREPVPFQKLGGKLYCNVTPAKLDYVRTTTDTMSMPQSFLTAVSFLLARNVTMPLTRKRQTYEDMNQLWERHLGLAIEEDTGSEPTWWTLDDGGYIESRGGYTSRYDDPDDGAGSKYWR
jgi:hypothetical protein